MLPELLVTGALNWDINLFVKRLPRSGEEVVVDRIERVPGGKGGNVSVAAARILGPGRVALMACLGRDEVGSRQVSILKEEGVDPSAVQLLEGVESGQAYITVDSEGTNAIETHFGANARLTQDIIQKPSVQSVLKSCSMMVVIDPPKSVAGKILAEGRRLDRSVLWHPGVLTRFGISEFQGDMEGVDYLVLNEIEARAFTNAKSLKQSLAQIHKAAPRARILVTLGKRGAAFYENGRVSREESIILDKLGRKVVNTTGCGDAFVGAFAAYKVLGEKDANAFRYANMAGALKAGRTETRGSPGRQELEDAFRKYFG